MHPRNTYGKKKLDPRNTYENKFWTHEMAKKKKDWTQEITTRKIFGPQKARWDGRTRLSMALDSRNSAHPYQKAYWMLFKKHAIESTVYFYRI